MDKVTLQRTADAPPDWWLEINSATQLDLRLYLPDEHGAWQARQSGERVSHAQGRDRAFRHMLFKLPTLTQQPLTLYLRTYDPAGNSAPMKAWQLDDLTQQASEENLFLGVVYGIIAALLLYNLFIFLSLRDSAYFWYVLTTAAALLMILSMSGHGSSGAVLAGSCHVALAVGPMRLSIYPMPDADPHLCALGAPPADVSLRLLCHCCGAGRFRPAPYCDLDYCLAVAYQYSSVLGSALIRWQQGYFPAFLYLCGYGLILGSISLALMRATGLVQPATWNAYVFPLLVAANPFCSPSPWLTAYKC